MASPSGTSSGSSFLHNSGSDEDLQPVMDQKKRKRMISNRESARRSRMRKQKHLDDLMAQVNLLKNENSQILTTLTLTTQHYYSVEAENTVLRTQMMELSNRLGSLNEILYYLNANNSINTMSSNGLFCDGPMINDTFINPWNFSYMNLPIMASADNMFQ